MSMADVFRTRMAMIQPKGIASGLGGLNEGIANAIRRQQFDRQMKAQEARDKLNEEMIRANMGQMQFNQNRAMAEDTDVAAAYASEGGTKEIPASSTFGGLPTTRMWQPSTGKGGEHGARLRALRESQNKENLAELAKKAAILDIQRGLAYRQNPTSPQFGFEGHPETYGGQPLPPWQPSTEGGTEQAVKWASEDAKLNKPMVPGENADMKRALLKARIDKILADLAKSPATKAERTDPDLMRILIAMADEVDWAYQPFSERLEEARSRLSQTRGGDLDAIGDELMLPR